MQFTFTFVNYTDARCMYVGNVHQCVENGVLISRAGEYMHIASYRVGVFGSKGIGVAKVARVSPTKLLGGLTSIYDWHVVPWKEVEYGTSI